MALRLKQARPGVGVLSCFLSAVAIYSLVITGAAAADSRDCAVANWAGGTWSWTPVSAPTTSISGVAANAADPRHVYVGTDSGLYVSHDGGVVWTRPLTEAVVKVAVDPTRSNVAYAATSYRLFATQDSGATWSPIKVFVGEYIRSVYVHPRDPQTIYVGTQAEVKGTTRQGLWRTRDGGLTWELLPYADQATWWLPWSITKSPTSERLLVATEIADHSGPKYQVGSKPSLMTDDEGVTWKEVPFYHHLTELFIDERINAIYAKVETDQGGLFRSLDDGGTWVLLDGPRSSDTDSPRPSPGFTHALDPHCSRNLMTGSDFWGPIGSTNTGVWLSSDGGSMFSRIGLPGIPILDVFASRDGRVVYAVSLDSVYKGVWTPGAAPTTPAATPTATPTPAATPTPTATPAPQASSPPPTGESNETIGRTVTLHVARHLIARGGIRSDPIERDCVRGIPVSIERRRGGRWREVRTTTTSREGFFKVRIPDRAGAYSARVWAQTLSTGAECSASRSATIRHRDR